RFPDHRHVASWAAICPGNEESAGKRKTGKTRKGDSWLRTALIEAANSAAGRTRDTYLNAQYVRIKRRRGHSKAIVAVAHSILIAAYYILQQEKPYQELGGDYFMQRENTDRLTRRLVQQLERLGQHVTSAPALVTPHSLRRTFCSLLYALGESPPVVMQEMGHTDPRSGGRSTRRRCAVTTASRRSCRRSSRGPQLTSNPTP